MFKNCALTRLLNATMMGLVLALSLSNSAFAWPEENLSGSQSTSTTRAVVTAAALAAAQVVANTVWGFVAPMFEPPENDENDPNLAHTAAAAAAVGTPAGYRRAPAAREAGFDFFMTPRTGDAEGVVYIQMHDDFQFTPIDAGNRRMSPDEALARLRAHPRFSELQRLVQDNLHRYVGQTRPKASRRFAQEARAAANGQDTRHLEGLREGLVNYMRAIFINVLPQDLLAIEAVLNREVRANHGNGLNSNSGSSKALKRSAEEAAGPRKKLFDDAPSNDGPSTPNDDDNWDDSDDDSYQGSPSL